MLIMGQKTDLISVILEECSHEPSKGPFTITLPLLPLKKDVVGIKWCLNDNHLAVFQPLSCEILSDVLWKRIQFMSPCGLLTGGVIM